MKKLFLSGLSAALFVPSILAAPDPLYENFGVLDFGTNAPQINATAFANYGDFTVASVMPYDTQNTLNFTNTGSMNGAAGFRFEFIPPSGPTFPASNFLLDSGADIVGFGTLVLYADTFFPASYIFVNATNIHSQGYMSVSTAGQVQLKGQHIDLSRGGIEFRPLDGGLGGYIPTDDDPPEFFVQFDPDLGIRDLFAATNLNEGFMPGNVITPIDEENVIISGGPIQLLNPLSYVFTNRVDTNVTVQAAFVGVNSPNVGVRTRFAPGGNTPLRVITVEFSMTSSNEVTATELGSTLYVIDRMGSHTNSRTLAANLLSISGTARPGNFELTRFQPLEFANGDIGNGLLVPELLHDDTFTNTVVTNYNATYQADVDFLPARPQIVPGSTPELLPGRLEIEADVLDLSRTRVRGEGFINIDTKHLVGSEGAAIEAENMSFNLASTNGLLRVQNLARDSMQRLRGQPLMWSTVWTNLSGETVTNIIEDPMDPTMMVTNVTTNTLEYVFHVLLIQSGVIGQDVPITTWSFKTESTNTVILDNMIVENEFRVNGESLEMAGEVTFAGTLRTWSETNAPNLRFFTNSGVLDIVSSANFGSDRNTPYERFVNSGSLEAFNISVDADEFENSGFLVGPGRFDLWTRTGKLDGGEGFFGGDVNLMARDIKFRNYTNQTQSRLNLMVTNSLVDSGGDAGSRLNVNRGFHLLMKPAEGDLLGTTLAAGAPRFSSILNRWAADDLGATAEGFSNNVAVGRLILSPAPNAELVLQGMGTSNAMYVDLLELAGTAVNDLENSVRIDTNLVVYFAYANQPVEELDGMLDGRLRWVRDFAGPNSSVEVLLANGRTILVNRGLRESRTIDSDGDGLANFFDPFPFDDVVITSTQVFAGDPPRLEISWRAAANTVYTIDYSTSIAVPEWQELMNYTNAVPTNRVVTVEDELPEGTPQRFYRVRYTP